jgi:hypothetical protein
VSAASATPRDGRAARDRDRRFDRLLEVIAVALLGVATVGSAWCGYQATRWNGEETDLAQEAARQETEATRLFGLATQTFAYDSTIAAQYAQALSNGDDELVAFYESALVRPEFLPVIERWRAEIAAGEQPGPLLEDQAYRDEQLAPYEAALTEVNSLTTRSDEASEHGDQYVLTTLLLATALFFAGVTTSFRVRTARLLLLASAVLVIAGAAARLADLPVA